MRRKNKHIVGGFIICILLTCSFTASAHIADVEGHWAAEQIEQWVHAGIIKGYEDNSFKPDSSITRAEFITVVNNVYKLEKEEEIDFSDISKDDWYWTEFRKAKAAGYISSYEDGTIRPNASVTRLEAAVILSKVSKLETSDHDAIGGLEDSRQIPQWGQGYVNAVLKQGYLKGYPDNTFKPEEPITRAEAVVALYRVSGTPQSTDKHHEEKTEGEKDCCHEQSQKPADTTGQQEQLETFTGWLIDYDCVGANPKTHSQSCSKSSICIASGFGIQLIDSTEAGEWLPFDIESQPFAVKFNALVPEDFKYIPTIKVTGYKVKDIPASDAAIPEKDSSKIVNKSGGLHIVSLELAYVEGVSHNPLPSPNLIVKDTDDI